MAIEFTQMSKENYEYLLGKDKTPKEIVEFLNMDLQIKPFSQFIVELYLQVKSHRGEIKEKTLAYKEECIGEMKSLLTTEITKITGEDRPSVSKKVSNWLKDKNIPQNREQLFMIAYILQFTERLTNILLGGVTDTGIHYRNPRELVYVFGLRTGMPFVDVEKLQKEVEKNIEGDTTKNEKIESSTAQIRDGY